MAEKISELIRDYQAGKITRRDFMRRGMMLTGRLGDGQRAAHPLLSLHGIGPGCRQ